MKNLTQAAAMSLVVCVAGVCVSGVAMAQAAERKAAQAFNIGAQGLASALKEFTRQTKKELFYTSELVANRKTAGVKGSLEPMDALSALLKNTGLQYSTTPSGAIVLAVAGSAGDVGAPADQMRLARMEDSDAATPRSSSEEEESRKNQVTVKDVRIRPYADSNIDLPRTVNDAQPYYIFDSQTIERSGVANLEEFLKRRLTMNASDAMSAQNGIGSSITGGGGNISRINLRGLGTDKTLILVNGRRRAGVVNASAEGLQQPDLNGIPLSAVDRIEVLPTSASGIYGGSAIGGVINVVLKSNYSGGRLALNYDNTLDTDAPRRTVSGLYGFSLEGGRTQITLSGNWSDSRTMLFGDRADLYRRNFAGMVERDPAYVYSPCCSVNVPLGTTLNILGLNNSLQPTPLLIRGTLESLGSSVAYLNPGVAPGTSRNNLYAMLRTTAGSYNLDLAPTAQRLGLLQPLGVDTEVRSVRVAADREMLSWLNAYAEASYSQNSSGGAYMDPGLGIFVSTASPVNPFAVLVKLGLLVPPDGNPEHDRNVANEYTARQLMLGLRAQLGGWTALLDYQFSENLQNGRLNNIDTTAFSRQVALGQIDPFVDTLLYPLDFTPFWYSTRNRSSSHLNTVSLRGSGPVFSLPWGRPRLTVGLEHAITRIPGQNYRVDYTVATSLVNNMETYYYPRKQIGDSGYAEAEVPLVAEARYPGLHSLSLQLSGRIDRSDVDAGTTSRITYYNRVPPSVTYTGRTLNNEPYFTRQTYESKNSTVGLKYQPVSWVTLRGSSATAFLPPLPSQLQRDPTVYQTTVTDPVRGQTPNVVIINGGNPDIQPQSSESFNAGLIVEPQWAGLKGLRLNAEYYSIKQFNAISALGVTQLLLQEANYPDRIARDANGFVTRVDNTLVNLYRRDTAGLDLSIGYDLDTRGGRFNLQAVESVIRRLRTQYSQSQPAYEAAGYHPNEGGAPKHKRSVMLTWDEGSWSAGWSMSYIGSYKQVGAAGGPTSVQSYNGAPYTYYLVVQGGDTVESQAYHDVFVGYAFDSRMGGISSRLLDGVSLTAGVRNIFDKAPPFDVLYSSQFYTSGYGDTRLRSYWLSATKSFN